jgi:hypothetical protein
VCLTRLEDRFFDLSSPFVWSYGHFRFLEVLGDTVVGVVSSLVAVSSWTCSTSAGSGSLISLSVKEDGSRLFNEVNRVAGLRDDRRGFCDNGISAVFLTNKNVDYDTLNEICERPSSLLSGFSSPIMAMKDATNAWVTSSS